MAVTKSVRAKDGESLCSIAVEHGFKNCNKLRPLNPAYAARHVEAGEKVDIPEVTPKQEAGQTEMLHRFQRLGSANRIWIIQDRHRSSGPAKLSDAQSELAVSNYVPGRQGTGFATELWKTHTFTRYSPGASADPDHFKVLVFDKLAGDRGDAEVTVNLQTQKPVLNSTDKRLIEKWDNIVQTGTLLQDIVCKQIEADSPWYQSCYLRLVVDEQDRTAKRRDGHNDPPAAVDTGADVSRQVLLVPPLPDKDIEILDYRVQSFRPAPHCETGSAADPQHCKAQSFAKVGKDEKVMRVKAIRVGGSGGAGVTDQEMRDLIYKSLRERFAQMNVGVKAVVEPAPGVTIVDNFIHDVDPPRNMIMISDYDGVRAKGRKAMTATVQLSTGNVTATIQTKSKATPLATANDLAAALRALGVVCRVSENPPISSSRNTFGSADILCFNPDGTMARVISTTSADTKQTISDTSGWSNAAVRSTGGAYPDPRGSGDAMLVGSPDYRVCAKNFVTGDTYLCAMVVNTLPGLNGEATGPYVGVVERFRPRPEFRLIVFLSRGGATSGVTLSHEGGHTLLDCFHTTGGSPERDHFGNAYPTNDNLAFSEWMSALPHTNQIRKRISDAPITVSLRVQRQGPTVTGAAGENKLMGGRDTPSGPINQTCVQRFRTLVPSVYENLRLLRPAPQTPL